MGHSCTCINIFCIDSYFSYVNTLSTPVVRPASLDPWPLDCSTVWRAVGMVRARDKTFLLLTSMCFQLLWTASDSLLHVCETHKVSTARNWDSAQFFSSLRLHWIPNLSISFSLTSQVSYGPLRQTLSICLWISRISHTGKFYLSNLSYPLRLICHIVLHK